METAANRGSHKAARQSGKGRRPRQGRRSQSAADTGADGRGCGCLPLRWCRSLRRAAAQLAALVLGGARRRIARRASCHRHLQARLQFLGSHGSVAVRCRGVLPMPALRSQAWFATWRSGRVTTQQCTFPRWTPRTRVGRCVHEAQSVAMRWIPSSAHAQRLVRHA